MHPRPPQPPAPPPLDYEWEIDMPLLTSRFLLYDFAKVFAGTALIMIVPLSAAFTLTGPFNAREFAAIAGMTALGIFAVAFLAVFVMVAFFGIRYRATAARRVCPTRDGLVFTSLTGSRSVPPHTIRRAEPLLRSGEPAGLTLHFAGVSPVHSDCSQMMNVEPARRAPRQFIRNGG